MRINILFLSLLFLTGCFRGAKFEEPPIHLNPNMDNQQKYRSLEEKKAVVLHKVNPMKQSKASAKGKK